MKLFATLDFCRRIFRAAKLILTDRTIPRWLRALAGVAALPIPGPFDELIGLVVLVLLLLLHRPALRRAWTQAA